MTKPLIVRPAVFGVAFMITCAQSAVAQDSGWVLALANARQLADNGSYRGAEAAYTAVLGLAGLSNNGRATAHFGRAYSAQQRVLNGDTAGSPVQIDAVLADYNMAQSLDSATYGAAMYNNIGILLKAVGRPADAVEYLRRAVGAAGPSRAKFLFNAGENFERLERFDSAAVYYRRALETDTSRTDALKSLLRVQLRSASTAAVLNIAERWARDSAHAAVVAAAVPDLLMRGRVLSDEDAVRTMDVFAAALPVGRVGFTAFQMEMRGRLLTARSARPQLQGGIDALVDAYDLRREPYREPQSARWWRAPGIRQRQRSAAWSSVLRWVGDLHNSNGQIAVARGFYQASLGNLNNLNRPDVDRAAILPLTLIYVQEANTEAERNLVNRAGTAFRIDAASGAGELEQIRQYHLTMATLYAARGRWDTAGAYNAEKQTELLRQAAQKLETTTNRAAYVPPNLLEKLAVHYRTTSRTAKADSVTQQVQAYYVRKNRTDEAAAAVSRIETANRDYLRPTIRRPDAGISAVARGGGGGGAERARSIVVEGVILDPSGRPVRDVAVTLIVDSTTRRITLSSEGRFRDSIPATAIRVRIRVQADGRTVERDVDVKNPTNIRIVLSGEPVSDQRIAIRGSITGPRGPVAVDSAALIVDGRPVPLRVDAAGSFTTSIPSSARTISIRVDARGFGRVDMTVNPRELIRVVLQPRAP